MNIQRIFYINSVNSGMLHRVFRFLKKLGPGIITAALVFGPGSLTLASRLGASFQYHLLWIILLSTIFMLVFSRLSARFGLLAPSSPMTVVKEKYGKLTGQLMGVGVFMVCICFQAGNSIGAGMAFAEMGNSDLQLWILFFTVVAIFLLFFRSFYRILEKVMIVLVGVMLIAFLMTVFWSGPDLSKVFQGLFIPSIPSGSEFLGIALIASSFSIVGAFFQAYLVKEKGWQEDDLPSLNRDIHIGIITLGLVSALVMIAAAEVLYNNQIEVQNAADMGIALEPVFGAKAFYVFMLGLFAASFSSLIGNASLGGTILADSFALGQNLAEKSVRLLIMLIVVLGSLIAIVFQDLRLQLISIAQGLTILVVPAIGLILFMLTNQKKLMRHFSMTFVERILALIGLLFLFFLCGRNFYLLFLQ